MDFTSASKISEVIDKMVEADVDTAANRARIDSLMNGDPPYTAEEEEENHIDVNYNSLEAPSVMHNARGMWNNAYLKGSKFFAVRLDSGPVYKRSGWAQTITTNLNRAMKRSLPYMEITRAQGAQLMLHGIGPQQWEKKSKWRARTLALADLKLPGRTNVDLENLSHLAIKRRYTVGELYRLTHGPGTDQGWNMPLVNKLLAKLAKENTSSENWDTYRWPEELEQDYKSNRVYWASDAAPTINVWDFFYQNEQDENEAWKRCILLDWENPTSGSTEIVNGTSAKDSFLYKPDRDYAAKREQFLHINFADGSNVAPFRYHTVRSLGYLLYGVCMLQNRLRCQFTRAVFESLLWYFRNVSDEDREKIQNVRLYHMGVIPRGIEYVPGNERFQVQAGVLELAFSQHRQLISENSASYLQDVDSGTQKEQTATETMAKVNQSNALVGALLNLAMAYKTAEYREICRRFCISTSTDSDVTSFREKCLRDGVPEQMLDVDRWDIEPERTMGDGNKIMQIAQAEKLMAVRPLHDPESQRIILHIYDEAVLDNPPLAEALVPMTQQEPSNAIVEAAQNMGTLMLGLPVPERRGLNPIEYIETLLGMMKMLVERIEQSGGMTDQKTLVGLITVGQEIDKHIEQLAEDKAEKERVKQYSDQLGQLMNLVKAFAQRLQEQMAKQGEQMPPEVLAKIQAATILAQSQARIKEGAAQQKMRHKEIAFVAEQRRRDQAAIGDMHKQLVQTKVDTLATDVKTAAAIRNSKKPSE